MAKLKLLLPGGKSFTVGSPFKKETKKLAGLSLIVNVISLVAASIFVLLLPLSNTLLSTDPETSTLKFLVTFVFIFLIILIAKLLIQGSSFIVDPKGLLMILVFNLVLTTISIMITTVRVSNTFGAIGFRYLSGLALMSLIGLFYFLNLYALNTATLKKLLNFFTAGSVLYVVWYLFTNNQTVSQVVANLPLLTIGFGLLTYRVLKEKNKKWGTFALLVFGILILIAIPFSSATYLSLFYFSLVLLIAYTLVLTLYALKSKKEVKLRAAQIKANIINFVKVKKVSVPTNKGLADLHLVIVFLLPVFMLLCTIFFYVNIPETNRSTVFVDVFTHYKDSIRMLTGGTYALDGNTLRPILLGVGSDNYNPSKPLLANVLIVSGIVGTAIYLALWLYFIKSAKDIFLRTLKEKTDFKLTGLILFSVLLIPFVFILSYSNLLTVIILWIMYSIVSVFQSKVQLNYLDNTLSVPNPRLRVIGVKVLVGVVAIIAVLHTLNLILGVLK